MIGLHKSAWYYRSVKDDSDVEAKLLALAGQYPTRGFDTYYGRIRNEGLKWNRKRVLRVYRKLGLSLRRKHKRRLPTRNPKPLEQPEGPNESWSMDFMSDALENGRRIRVLNIVDDFNREVLWSQAAFSFPAEHLVDALKEICRDRGKPSSIRCDNGPEFISYTLKDWAEQFQIHIDYIQPGKPNQNGYVERFNRTLREDVLDAYLFDSLEDVQQTLDAWCEDYNCSHPHQSLGGVPPIQYRAMESGEADASPHATAPTTMN